MTTDLSIAIVVLTSAAVGLAMIQNVVQLALAEQADSPAIQVALAAAGAGVAPV